MKTLKKLFWWCLWLGVVFGILGLVLPAYEMISWKNGVIVELAAFVFSTTAVAVGSEYNRRREFEIWNSKYDWIDRLD